MPERWWSRSRKRAFTDNVGTSEAERNAIAEVRRAIDNWRNSKVGDEASTAFVIETVEDLLDILDGETWPMILDIQRSNRPWWQRIFGPTKKTKAREAEAIIRAIEARAEMKWS